MAITGGTSNLAGIVFGDTADDDVSAIIHNNSGNYLYFNTSSTERMRIDSSGNLLVGKTAFDDGATKGFTHYSGSGDSATFITRSNNPPLNLNRLNSDGEILRIRKDGTTVGSIGAVGGDLAIYSTSSSHAGLRFLVNGILPTDNAGTINDNTVDLGGVSNRFKDLVLSGGVYLGGTGSANKLDDYEEGTWTPASIAGVSLTVNAAVYTKIGRVVHIGMAVVFASNTNSSAVQFSGLPFAVRDQNDQAYGATIANTDVGTDNIYFAFLRNTTQIGVGNNLNQDVANSVYSGKKLCLSGFYFTDE